ncbi:hypothetical protein Pfo_030819, partial [Paulownia fortunei]
IENNTLFLLLLYNFLVVVYAYDTNSKSVGQKQVSNWCVALPDAPIDKLQGFINYGCAFVDCKAIQVGGPCFEPNTVLNHANYVLNLVYKNRGTCNLDIGTIITAINWCVVQVNAPIDKLQGFIDYACGVVDCTAIQVGGTCFNPNTIVSHASYALNLVYKNRGACNFDIGTITITDPSFITYELHIIQFMFMVIQLMEVASIH